MGSSAGYTYKLVVLRYKKMSTTMHSLMKGGNSIQDGDKKIPPTSFSHIPSPNIGISPQNFLNFSF